LDIKAAAPGECIWASMEWRWQEHTKRGRWPGQWEERILIGSLGGRTWATVVYWTGKGQSSIAYLIRVVVFTWDVERRLSLYFFAYVSHASKCLL
jgi:hypothetical protein